MRWKFSGQIIFEFFSDSCLLFIDTYFSSIKSYKSNFGSCDLTNCLSTCLMVKKGPKKGTTGMASSFCWAETVWSELGRQISLWQTEAELVSFPPKQHKQNKQVLLDFLTKNSSRLILTYSSTNTIWKSHREQRVDPARIDRKTEVHRLETENYY